MQKQVKTAAVILLAAIAILAVLAGLTNALPALEKARPAFFALSALFFLASIFLWLLPWSLLIGGRKTGLCETTLIGFSCVFAALTPVQVGADALRSVKMKEASNLPYSDSISASMAIKGIKFLFISVLAALSFSVTFFNPILGLWVKAALLSGFAVIVIAVLLFLLPLRKGVGEKIASLFAFLSRFFSPFQKLSSYFQKYGSFLQNISMGKIALVSLLALASLLFELVAFFYAFLSVEIAAPFYSVLAIFSILIILERTPFLPRGIGVVELAAFILLSSEGFAGLALNSGEIAAVIILFDVVRLIIPTALSLALYFALSSKKRLAKAKLRENKNPENAV